MVTWEDLKNATLGQTFDIRGLEYCCRAVYASVVWPGKREGGAVVVAMNHAPPLARNEVCLLAEVESFSVRDLVRHCGALDSKYSPKIWIGDGQYGPANRFTQEMNENLVKRGRQPFSPIEPFELLEMKPLYPYILDEIKRLLAPDRRQLFLPDESKILSYLSGIESEDITELELGAYPLIEALAFAVIEMMRDEKDVKVVDPNHKPWDNNTLTRGFKIGNRRRH